MKTVYDVTQLNLACEYVLFNNAFAKVAYSSKEELKTYILNLIRNYSGTTTKTVEYLGIWIIFDYLEGPDVSSVDILYDLSMGEDSKYVTLD